MQTKWTTTLSAALVALAMLASPTLGQAQPGRTPAGAPQPPSAGVVKGKVVEKLEGGGYVYLLVQQGAEKLWCAVPGTDTKVGDEVTVDTQALMGGFESKSLKRKFDQVYFGTLRGAPSAPAAMAAPAPAATPAPDHAKAQLKGKVAEVLQVPGYTYMRLSTAEGDKWVAVPTTEVAVGTEVGVHGTSVMDGFESKVLKRKFEHIVFGSALSRAGAAKPANHP